ncbi:MAG: hypothetical protein K6G30_04300 [Acetatifactor sp.]|nr:hypothetical protein [Acetatifactor sp.]
MGRTARDNRDTFRVKPVEKIELSEKHIKFRFILVILFAIIGIGLLVYTAFSHLAVHSGWETIAVSSSAEMNCSKDFVFQYHLGVSGVSPTVEKKTLVTAYTAATVKAYQLFNNDAAFSDVRNVFYLNHHPNEIVTVDEVLYHAFEQLDEAGNRLIYLSPLYGQYDNLFTSQNDTEAFQFDPYLNEELALWFGEIADFAKNPEDVEIRLLGDNQVELFVSERYLDYAKDYMMESFIDFYWMKNAFIIDYLAQELSAQGFLYGNLSSYDGFTRNMEPDGEEYAFHLYDRWDNTVYTAATMNYNGRKSIVYLRDYPMNSVDSWHYYEAADGRISFPYVDIADGFDRCSLHNIVGYSVDAGCSEILMKLIPLYVTEKFDADAALQLCTDNIFVVYFEQGELCYTDKDLRLTDLDNLYKERKCVK